MLNKLLNQKGLSKYSLWKISKVPQSTISDICSGKTDIKKCSAETIYRLAKALGVSMEELVAQSVERTARPSFEIFKSTICHQVKDMGDTQFLLNTLESNSVREYYEKGWYPEALYLLAMVDYISRLNEVPMCKNYNDIRTTRLKTPIYPADIITLCAILKSNSPKAECVKQAIPEFLRFNIIECEVRDVF